ncbi:MAG: glycosyltransferase [Dolichospermum sp. DET50]|nr:glycosyltransferase [Dolichospermum sp. DET66]MBS3032564.1 glycosyltransferase [Dolichospermum sp. DET67]MBS3037770.1 glycosyltransferase [Dolichospermum sp. DET50]QSX69710.1 MAG: glycosyltransferase [Dolichospermum sp. DET69]
MIKSHSEPSFSVIIAVYNNVQYLQRCIDSFIAQSYGNKELIIIDGQSTDGTVDIIRNNSTKIAYWESEPDRGIYHAFNKGVSHATAEWIIFLGADDYFYNSDVLNNVAKKLVLNSSSVRLVYGRVAMVSDKNEVLQIMNKSWEKSKHNFLQVFNINHQGVFHHHCLFKDKGLFDESFRLAGDYELLLRELKDNDAYFLDGDIIAYVQIGGVSTSPENYLKVYKEFYRARSKNAVKGIPYRLMFSFLTAYIRLMMIKILGNNITNNITDFYRKLGGQLPLWTKL